MRRAQKQFAYFCKSSSIFDWLSVGEIDTGLSYGKIGCLRRSECPYFVPWINCAPQSVSIAGISDHQSELHCLMLHPDMEICLKISE